MYRTSAVISVRRCIKFELFSKIRSFAKFLLDRRGALRYTAECTINKIVYFYGNFPKKGGMNKTWTFFKYKKVWTFCFVSRLICFCLVELYLCFFFVESFYRAPTMAVNVWLSISPSGVPVWHALRAACAF